MKRFLDLFTGKIPGRNSKALFYKVEPLKTAPSFWALIPVRVEANQIRQQANVSSHFTNKNC